MYVVDWKWENLIMRHLTLTIRLPSPENSLNMKLKPGPDSQRTQMYSNEHVKTKTKSVPYKVSQSANKSVSSLLLSFSSFFLSHFSTMNKVIAAGSHHD